MNVKKKLIFYFSDFGFCWQKKSAKRMNKWNICRLLSSIINAFSFDSTCAFENNVGRKTRSLHNHDVNIFSHWTNLWIIQVQRVKVEDGKRKMNLWFRSVDFHSRTLSLRWNQLFNLNERFCIWRKVLRTMLIVLSHLFLGEFISSTDDWFIERIDRSLVLWLCMDTLIEKISFISAIMNQW